uniref:Uncharacterized protein n=1 Tax=Anopheles culicifacies TaxID=139723 RepID=A0A182MAT5_9DIPT
MDEGRTVLGQMYCRHALNRSVVWPALSCSSCSSAAMMRLSRLKAIALLPVHPPVENLPPPTSPFLLLCSLNDTFIAAICLDSSFRQLARSLLRLLISSACSFSRFSVDFDPLLLLAPRCSYSSTKRCCSCRLFRAFSSLLSSPYAYCVAVKFLRTLFSSLLIL